MPKAIRFHQLGGPEVLTIEEVPSPEPAAGEVVLKVAAVGLNRAESMYFHGQYLEQPQLPSGLGYEVVGTVTKVGPGGDQSLIGKQFGTVPGYSQNKYPGLGEEALAPADDLAALPPSLDPVAAAASWMQYGTAYDGIVNVGKVTADDFVIITAASSSVGLAAIEMVRDLGATAIATTRTSQKKQELLDFGAPFVIASEEEDLPARVREITNGKGARVIYDPIGGDGIHTLAQASSQGAVYILYGMLSGQPTPYPLSRFGQGFSMTSSSISTARRSPETYTRMKSYVYDRLASGAFKPKIAKTFPFAQTVEAYKYLESNQQVGKIVITF